MLDPDIAAAMTGDVTGDDGKLYAAYYPYDPLSTIEKNEQVINPELGVARNNIAESSEDENGNDNQIYGYDRYENKPFGSAIFGNDVTSPKVQRQKVQVTSEETGSQRVQVNNGFQEEFVPGLNTESGHLSSGVLLEWRLTFYGTGPNVSEEEQEEDTKESKSKGEEEDDEEEEEEESDGGSSSQLDLKA